MTTKANKLINDWGLPERTEERQQVTLRLDFDTYAKLNALKNVFPHKSVNQFMNDILKSGVDDIIDQFGDPQAARTDFVEEAGGLVDFSENNAYRFMAAYRIILEDGSVAEVVGLIQDSEGEQK